MVALHNFLMLYETTLPRHELVYCSPGYIDFKGKNAIVVPGTWRSDTANNTGHYCGESRGRHSNVCTKTAKDVREKLTNFFISPAGAVSWQNEYINK